MSIVLVRVNYKNNWVDRSIKVPNEFNFPSSRIYKLDGLHEWLKEHFKDKSHNSGYPSIPSMFYIKEINGKSVFKQVTQ